MDKTDLDIVEFLQTDASCSLNELAEAVHLSPTPCWRRVQRLRERGVLKQQVTLCDPTQLDLRVTAFVFIRAAQHNESWMQRFVEGARTLPEIVEIHRMAGEIDYLLKVCLPDIAAYDRFYKKLIGVADLQDISASFSMETVKFTTALPVDHLRST